MEILQETAAEYRLKATTNSVPTIQITSPAKAAEFARQFYQDDLTIFESCFLMLLNQSNKVIGWVKISQGGIASTVVDKRIVAKYAIESLATAVILVHNHPSGNATPSMQDRNVTAEIEKGLALFDIKLFDHIILTEDTYTSLADAL